MKLLLLVDPIPQIYTGTYFDLVSEINLVYMDREPLILDSSNVVNKELKYISTYTFQKDMKSSRSYGLKSITDLDNFHSMKVRLMK